MKDGTLSDTSRTLLNSMIIMLHEDRIERSVRPLKVECQLWTNGLDRSFKVSTQG